MGLLEIGAPLENCTENDTLNADKDLEFSKVQTRKE